MSGEVDFKSNIIIFCFFIPKKLNTRLIFLSDFSIITKKKTINIYKHKRTNELIQLTILTNHISRYNYLNLLFSSHFLFFFTNSCNFFIMLSIVITLPGFVGIFPILLFFLLSSNLSINLYTWVQI